VTYTTQKNPNITETTWLTSYKPILYLNHINENHWIIVNVQQAGEYKSINLLCFYVRHINKILCAILHIQSIQTLFTVYVYRKYLYSTNNLNIHVLNRAQIIDDAYYFLSTYKLNFIYFKSLTLYLSNETDYVAWYPMFKILEHASSFFPFSQSTEVKVNHNILIYFNRKF